MNYIRTFEKQEEDRSTNGLLNQITLAIGQLEIVETEIETYQRQLSDIVESISNVSDEILAVFGESSYVSDSDLEGIREYEHVYVEDFGELWFEEDGTAHRITPDGTEVTVWTDDEGHVHATYDFPNGTEQSRESWTDEDGNRHEVVDQTSANGTAIHQETINDGENTTTTTSQTNPDGSTVQTETTVNNTTGISSQETTRTDADGNTTRTEVTTSYPDGHSETTTTYADGTTAETTTFSDGGYETTITNADGSTETYSENADGSSTINGNSYDSEGYPTGGDDTWMDDWSDDDFWGDDGE